MRILDSAFEKHDMETPAKPKRLPITQKFYAFYHAPIVKFWFNTVSFFLCVVCILFGNVAQIFGFFSQRVTLIDSMLSTFQKADRKPLTLLSWKCEILDFIKLHMHMLCPVIWVFKNSILSN